MTSQHNNYAFIRNSDFPSGNYELESNLIWCFALGAKKHESSYLVMNFIISGLFSIHVSICEQFALRWLRMTSWYLKFFARSFAKTTTKKNLFRFHEGSNVECTLRKHVSVWILRITGYISFSLQNMQSSLPASPQPILSPHFLLFLFSCFPKKTHIDMMDRSCIYFMRKCGFRDQAHSYWDLSRWNFMFVSEITCIVCTTI